MLAIYITGKVNTYFRPKALRASFLNKTGIRILGTYILTLYF